MLIHFLQSKLMSLAIDSSLSPPIWRGIYADSLWATIHCTLTSLHWCGLYWIFESCSSPMWVAGFDVWVIYLKANKNLSLELLKLFSICSSRYCTLCRLKFDTSGQSYLLQCFWLTHSQTLLSQLILMVVSLCMTHVWSFFLATVTRLRPQSDLCWSLQYQDWYNTFFPWHWWRDSPWSLSHVCISGWHFILFCFTHTFGTLGSVIESWGLLIDCEVIDININFVNQIAHLDTGGEDQLDVNFN